MPRKHKVDMLLQDIMNNGCHAFVEARVNGVPARLLIDTGASKTILDKTYLMAMEPIVPLLQSEHLSTGFGAANLPSEFAQDVTLELSTLSISNLHVAVLDLYHVNETYKSIGLPPLHGVLGGDLLARHAAVIDYKKQLLRLQAQKKKRGKQEPCDDLEEIDDTLTPPPSNNETDHDGKTV